MTYELIGLVTAAILGEAPGHVRARVRWAGWFGPFLRLSVMWTVGGAVCAVEREWTRAELEDMRHPLIEASRVAGEILRRIDATIAEAREGS